MGEGNGNGRWFSEARVIAGLFAMLLGIGGWWASSLGARLEAHAGQLRALELMTTKHDSAFAEILRRLDQIDKKLDR